jgi:ABC-2 type transport system ATP-binding protein
MGSPTPVICPLAVTHIIAPPMAAVAASGLTKRYATRPALAAVDLSVAAGELHGLLGPNGAGKTTLLRILLGLVRPDGGSVELLGESLRSGQPVREGVAGFVEDPCFYPYLSGRANLEVLAELDGPAAAARIDEALEAVRLTSRAADHVGGYSSGMRQRLGIAACLIRRPRVLLLDEPTTGLDPKGARDVGALLQGLAADGVAVLLSSHQIGELERLCDRFSVLSEGQLRWSGSAQEMRTRVTSARYRLGTSDDGRALAVGGGRQGLSVETEDAGLTVTGDQDVVDEYVLALAASGVAVRALELSMNPLEALFFELTQPPA